MVSEYPLPQILQPGWLWLWPVVILWSFRWRRYLVVSLRQQIQLVHPQLADQADHLTPQQRGPGLVWLLQALALSCLLLALARPQTITEPEILPPDGREFVLLVDSSLSMGVTDFYLQEQEIRRIDVLKGTIRRFIEQRKHDHFSLITFSSLAATLVPMTADHQLINMQLQRLQLGLLGDGTAIGQALALAVKNLQQTGGQVPVFILFSDGENTTGEMTPRDALILAQQSGAHIYSVAITGAAESSEMNADEPGLRELSRLSGGRYYHAADSHSLQQIINDVDQLEKNLSSESTQRRLQEWYPVLIMLGVVLLAVSRLLALWKEQR